MNEEREPRIGESNAGTHTSVAAHPGIEIVDAVVASANAKGFALDGGQRELLENVAAYLADALGQEGQDGLDRYPGEASTIPAGFFVHGPAGRGKTWLMTEIFHAAPVPESAKCQVHFHTFFQELQRSLAGRLSAREAIEQTVAELLDGTQLFFFDELHVHDPGGAALLNRLVAALADRGVPTLFTSNYEPEKLLDNRIYHHVVEPTISLIRDRFEVRTLDTGTDYRRSGSGGADSKFASGTWIVARDPKPSLVSLPEGLVPPTPDEATTVLDGHKALSALAARDREVWFDFADLLESMSIAQDYLELAEHFDDWVITGVPPLARASRQARQRFVSLIDVLVHTDRRLTVVAEVDRATFVDVQDPPADLFRAESRLALLGSDQIAG